MRNAADDDTDGPAEGASDSIAADGADNGAAERGCGDRGAAEMHDAVGTEIAVGRRGVVEIYGTDKTVSVAELICKKCFLKFFMSK